MNNIFSPCRFWRYAKADLANNRHFYILLLLGFFAIVMIIYYMNYMIAPEETVYIQDASGEWVKQSGNPNFIPSYSLSWALIVITSLVIISFAFRNFHKKSYSSFAMMTPVSQLEKFTYTYLLNIIVMPVAFTTIAWLVAQGWAMGRETGNHFISLPSSDDGVNTFIWIVTQLVTFTMIVLTAYLYGAVLFRRMQFLFTTLCVAGFIVLFAVIESYTNLFSETFGYKMLIIDVDFTCRWFVALGVVALFTWLAWRKFHTLQITK